jgi:predicted TIM-barrel fold metal-dependent hydrolase
MSNPHYDLVDFHNHHIPARFKLTAGLTQPAFQRARWEMLARSLPDEDLLLQDVREGHLSARVVNIPANLIADSDGYVPRETIAAMNDDLAGLVARHPGRIYGLASVDAYDGEFAAREAERAISQLKLSGFFVDCARGEMLINASQARPTLAVAAKYRVPVFVHPIAPQPLTKQMVPYGLVGTLFARGTVNSASLIALVEGGVFSELPDLRVVVTAHALGGLAMLAGLSGQSRQGVNTLDILRRHVFMDTTLINPALIRAAVELLGPSNVLAGSDWPIASEKPIAEALAGAMREAGLSADQQREIASGNALRLLRQKS